MNEHRRRTHSLAALFAAAPSSSTAPQGSGSDVRHYAAVDASVAADTGTDPAVATLPYYVATTGEDTNPGTLASPWRTLQHAMDHVPAGATIYARAGVYSERVTANKSGAPGQPITLTSYPGESAVLDGTHVAVVDGATTLPTMASGRTGSTSTGVLTS